MHVPHMASGECRWSITPSRRSRVRVRVAPVRVPPVRSDVRVPAHAEPSALDRLCDGRDHDHDDEEEDDEARKILDEPGRDDVDAVQKTRWGVQKLRGTS